MEHPKYRSVCVFFASLLLFAAPASAQRSGPEWDQCASVEFETIDAHIRACTALIESSRLSQQDRAIAYFNRGLAWEAKEDFDRAIADFSKAIQLDPKNDNLYVHRANSWNAKKDFDRAIADYDETIRLDPKQTFALNNRGNVWASKGDLNRAITDYDTVIRLDPTFIAAYNNRGDAWREKGNLDRAIADYSEAIRRDPGDSFAMFGTTLRLNPKFAHAYQMRGNAWSAKGDSDRALADYNAALKSNPKLAGSLYGRGIIKLRKGDAAGGNADIAAAKAIQADIAEEFRRYGLTAPATVGAAQPAPPAADCSQAETHWKAADSIGALAAYEDHLAQFPNCVFATMAKLKIEALKARR